MTTRIAQDPDVDGYRVPAPVSGRSSAVLVGINCFCHDQLEDLPAINANVTALHGLLTSPDVLGLAPERCVTVTPPAPGSPPLVPDTVLRLIERTAGVATDTFILYYAGHGETCGTADKLYLTLPDSDPAIDYTMVQYDNVRGILRRAGHVSRKVVILDCCFSARAMDGRMGRQPLERLARPDELVGTVVLTAAAENRFSMAPSGSAYTAFTGELLAILGAGIPSTYPVLTVESLYDELWKRMQEAGFPEPQCSTRNLSRKIGVAYNRGVQAVSRLPTTHPVAADPIRQADAERVLDTLARRKPQLSTDMPNMEQWAAIRDYLMIVVQSFDRRPFAAYRSADGERQPVLLAETVLPRVAELSALTSTPEWVALADDFYNTWVSEQIEQEIPELVQTEVPDFHSIARKQWKKDRQTAPRQQFIDKAVLLIRQSAAELLPGAAPEDEPTVVETPEPIAEIPPFDKSDGGYMLASYGMGGMLALLFVVAVHLGSLNWLYAPAVVPFMLGVIIWWVKMANKKSYHYDELPARMRAHFGLHKPWAPGQGFDDRTHYPGN